MSVNCAELRTIAWKTASRITEVLLRRSMVFSTVLTSYQNTEHQTSQGYIPLGFEKKKKEHVHSKSIWPWLLGRELYH